MLTAEVSADESTLRGYPESLPSPFGRGAGGEGGRKSDKMGPHLAAECPHPNPLPVGEGTIST